MPMSFPRWTSISDSQFPWEREALDWLRGEMSRSGHPGTQALLHDVTPIAGEISSSQGHTFRPRSHRRSVSDEAGGSHRVVLRTKQVVVVGDAKQLPPTDFFQRSETASEDDDFVDVDDESILAACQQMFRKTRLLRGHYRSRCESLIAFSNKEFYRNGLITFPTARPNAFSIELVPVAGNYDASRNVIEAQRVAEQAIEFMSHHADRDQDHLPSLGIVAVNSQQRELIFEEMRRLEAGDDLVEMYREKVARKHEPLFIKKLEIVQGDERDFMFISITYGPKPGQNHVLQRFGPISGKQGHRRLNVLFTRARERIVLFTSMTSADVKLLITRPKGPVS
jgi:superfamily I DNA and/or RNA helicase